MPPVGRTSTRTVPLVGRTATVLDVLPVGRTATVPDALPVSSLPVVGLPVVPVVIPLAVLPVGAHTCGSASLVGTITFACLQ